MIIKCWICKREFDTKQQKKDHERNAHPGGIAQYLLEKDKATRAAQQSKGGQQP